MALKELAKMRVGGGKVAGVHALKRQPVTREGVIGILGKELFKHLAARFILFRHWAVSYYTDTIDGVQDCGERGVRMKRKNGSIQVPETELPGKPVSASRSEMTEIVLPAQTNPLGKLLGGQVMHLVDMATALGAHRHPNSFGGTASVEYI